MQFEALRLFVAGAAGLGDGGQGIRPLEVVRTATDPPQPAAMDRLLPVITGRNRPFAATRSLR